jgi:hypothetical protein
VHDDRWWLPELYRLDARRHRGATAGDLLRRAIAVAERQGAVTLARRAAGDLAEQGHAAATDGERSPNA